MARIILTADVANSANDVLANVTGLSFGVVATRTYWFRASIAYTAAATGTGSRWTINGPASPTFLAYRSEYTLTATTTTINSGLTAYQGPAAGNASSIVAGNCAIVEGIIVPSVDGTLAIQFASHVNASAITAKAGSFIEYRQLI